MSIEYLNPTDRYDIEVFNRNFRRIADAMNNAPPLDWLNLQDLSIEEDQMVCMLLHIDKRAHNREIFYLSASEETNVIVDWGDGSISKEPQYAAGENMYFNHIYDYDQLNAPVTAEGFKQVIVTIKDDPEKEHGEWYDFYPSYNYTGNYSSTNLIRAIAVQAGKENVGMYAHFENLPNLYSIVCHNLLGIEATGCPSLCSVDVTGSIFNDITVKNAKLSHLSIPDNPYIVFNLSYSNSKELLLNLSETTVPPNLTYSYCIERLKLNGLKQRFSLSRAPMTREAIIELFESLGNADMTLSNINRTINLKTLSAYPELTAADKKIATDKGFIIS